MNLILEVVGREESETLGDGKVAFCLELSCVWNSVILLTSCVNSGRWYTFLNVSFPLCRMQSSSHWIITISAPWGNSLSPECYIFSPWQRAWHLVSSQYILKEGILFFEVGKANLIIPVLWLGKQIQGLYWMRELNCGLFKVSHLKAGEAHFSKLWPCNVLGLSFSTCENDLLRDLCDSL